MSEADPGAHRVLVIADDLTGAADTGLPFRTNGLTVHVRFADSRPSGALPAADVLAITTETRGVSAREAEGALRDAASRFPTPDVLFKKIDSTLRGWAGIETRALLDSVSPERIAWIVPAYPKQGRVMADGVYFVNGRPLAETEFAPDIPGCPGDSRLLPLFEGALGKGSVQPVSTGNVREGRIAEGSGIRALLFDAATDEHIDRIVGAARTHSGRPILWVGSAGLAGALARRERDALANTVLFETPPKTVVTVVAGSRHAVTRRQVAYLKAHTPSLNHQVISTVSDNNRTSAAHDILLTLPAEAADAPPLQAAARLGAAAVDAIARSGSRSLIVTGGDIAAAVCRGLGAASLELVGTVEDGMPLLRLHGGAAPGALVVTKAGGFGTEESLTRAFKRLSERP